jgi:ParB family transcriptional regulator, chromosome partitioning protein
MAKKRLGIDALFASTVVPAAAEAGVRRLGLDSISPNPNQPRRLFEETALANLVESIKKSGVLQPIIVRERTTNRPDRALYEIVAGERRWRAARMAGLSEIPAIVKSLSDEEALNAALTENLQREDLNPVEETEGYLALLKIRLGEAPEFASLARAGDIDPFADVLRLLFAMNNQRASEKADEKRGVENRNRGSFNNNVVIKLAPIVESAFASIGKTNWLSFIQHRLPLRRLPADLLEALRSGKLEYTKARLLGRITAEAIGCEEAQASKLRARLLERTLEESLSLGALKQLIRVEIEALAGSKGLEGVGEDLQLKELAEKAFAEIEKLRPEQLSGRTGQQIQQKLDELRRLIERASQGKSETNRKR